MLTPRENLKLIGHQEAQNLFLEAFHSSRFPHAWILSGPVGIGKATFAFHMARYILSGRQNRNTAFSDNEPLQRRIVAQSHGDLKVLGNEPGQEIGIEAIRELNSFLNQTSAEGGWRIIIIDGAETLNRNAANALLKRLEEPPSKTAFFLITAHPGRLLPTIRSRCQVLPFSALRDEEVREVLFAQGFKVPNFVSSSYGNPGHLIRLMEGEGAEIYADLQKVLKGQPSAHFVHKYAGEEEAYNLIEECLRSYLHNNLLDKVEGKPSCFKEDSLDQALKIYEKVEALFNEYRFAQLDRKTTLACVFANLENRNN